MQLGVTNVGLQLFCAVEKFALHDIMIIYLNIVAIELDISTIRGGLHEMAPSVSKRLVGDESLLLKLKPVVSIDSNY